MDSIMSYLRDIEISIDNLFEELKNENGFRNN